MRPVLPQISKGKYSQMPKSVSTRHCEAGPCPTQPKALSLPALLVLSVDKLQFNSPERARKAGTETATSY